MARPHKSRTIELPPLMKGFKPFGLPMCNTKALILHYEEYESIRLIDYEMLSQEEAAERMKISRPTITRIYNKAHKTIAKAFIEGQAIEIEGGNYSLHEDWYRCNRCHKLIQGINNHIKCKGCPAFGSEELSPIQKGNIPASASI